MARTSENENLTRQAEMNSEGQANQSYDQANSDIGQFNQNEATLDRGGQVASNPWKSAGYLSNVNRLQSGALNSETDSAQDALQRTNRRTGGFNTGAVVGAQKGLALDKMRMGSEMSAGRAAQDFNKNVNYQQQQAGAPLMAAGAEAPLYGTAANLTGSTNKDLTGYGMAQQQYLYSMYNKAIQAAGAAASAGAGGGGFGGAVGDAGGAVS